ncbi:DUF6898 family protein [Eilatimonas milleporae]|uniref:DUF6898 domain-containing protein n=1 Tax=Eilatimonas milleporae TaxID=911205 RepID=A0A3M0CHT7_9PROT|nr:hypothetical protein [Eilatimonas milleporae]RMB08892.1 hypothetical protein BXY39_1539 [Eilatimonas milleporae]
MPERDQVIFEVVSHGTVAKVSAICVRTGLEVSIVGDPRVGDAALKALALRKLNYVRQKKADTDKGSDGSGGILA